MATPILSENELREKIVVTYRQVVHLGLIKGTAGNISCRYKSGMLISPGRASAENLALEHIVAMDLDGNTEGQMKPSSEWQMHAQIYLQIPHAHAVIHTHSDYCVALACCRKPIPAFHYMIPAFGGEDVPCVPYATFGTSDLAKNATLGLHNRKACLLGNHGMICHGPDLDTAVSMAYRLETLAHQYVLSLQVGNPYILNSDEIRDVLNRVHDYYG